jgi:HCOMODA/2-hydroxy-3-carboxy-muconic semialdehyde decarboxylase
MPPAAAAHLQVLVRKAARALARAGLVGAFGHCSARIDGRHFLVCAAKPMGLIEPSEQGNVVAVDQPLPSGVLGEVRVHQQIYRRRPEINGVCRTLPPSIVTLSVMRRTPQARNVMGSYFAPHPPLWDDPLLLRSDEKAAGVADSMGKARAIVMRGNGAVVAAPSLEEAVGLTWFLEEAARMELACLQADIEAVALTADEAAALGVSAGRVFERLWEFMTRGDPE